jgi:molybdenum cofactor cytidylyltransferase
VTGGLVLAAGAGTRFAAGGSKLLAELDGRPVLEYVVTAMCAVAELDRIVVVLGAHADAVRERVAFGRAEPVRCPDWAEGMAASLRCGAGALAEADRVLVALGDAPDLTPEVVRRLLAAPAGARAVYSGRPGHPVILGPRHLARLVEVHGDVGARELLEAGPRIECGDLASGADIDTVADLEEVRSATRAIV